MEQKFGCAFNPRPAPGRCIKDPSYKKIDIQCQSIDNTCKLVSSSVPPPSTLPPAPSFIAPSVSPIVKEKVSTKTKNDRISGPVSAYITDYNGKKYEFFGDVHLSFSGGCSKPCKDVDINDPNLDRSLSTLVASDEDNCWDIAVFLSNLFNQAAAENKWIDFYIEIPFIKLVSLRKDIKQNIEESGYLSKLYYIFYNCFTKIKCNYSTTRFHYTDVRKHYRNVDLGELTESFRKELEQEGRNIFTDQFYAVYESYIIYERIRKSINFLKNMISDKKRGSVYIEETDKLVKDLFFTSGQSMVGKPESKNAKIFKLCLLSDNFDHDVKELMKESLQITREPIKVLEVLVPSSLIVNRRGKNMHRVRAQLEALENEGNHEMANKIISYILDRYMHRANNSSIIDFWRSLMITYEGYLSGKLRNIDNISMIFEKLNIENLKKAGDQTTQATALLLDTYLIARMFRSFPNKSHVESSKNIVYAGDFHIQTYVDFFEKMLGSTFIKYEPNKEMFGKYYNKDPTFILGPIKRCLNVNVEEFF